MDDTPSPFLSRLHLSTTQFVIACLVAVTIAGTIFWRFVGAPAGAAADSTCTVAEGAPMSTTAALAAESARSLVAKDSAHLAAMMAAQQIVLLKTPGRARVLSKEGAAIQVRLTDPAALGLERWIPHQFCS